MRLPPERLEQRFDRLRKIVTAWEIRYNQLPERVVPLFDAQDLDSIRELVEEKRQMRQLIPDVHEFVERWESAWSSGAFGNED